MAKETMTMYHPLSKPITMVKSEAVKGSARRKVSIWINHNLAGVLVIQVGEAERFVSALFDTSIVVATVLDKGEGRLSKYTLIRIDAGDLVIDGDGNIMPFDEIPGEEANNIDSGEGDVPCISAEEVLGSGDDQTE